MFAHLCMNVTEPVALEKNPFSWVRDIPGNCIFGEETNSEVKLQRKFYQGAKQKNAYTCQKQKYLTFFSISPFKWLYKEGLCMCFYTKQICFLEQCRKCSRKPSLLVIFLMQKYTCIFVSSEFMETLMADPAVIHKGLPKRMVGLPSDGASVADFFLNTGFFFFFNAKCFTQLKTM